MSIQAIAWVLDNSQAEGVARLVLIALANHANSETGQCDPGQRRIAHEANCSKGTVADAVGRLVKLGEVKVLERGKGHATTKYHLPWLSTGLRSAQPRVGARESLVPSSAAVVPNATALVPTPGVGETYRTVNQNHEDDVVLPADVAVAAIESARSVVRSKPKPVSKFFEQTPDAAKQRHPSNLPERKDLE